MRGLCGGPAASQRPLKSTDGLLHYQHPLYLDLVYCGLNYKGPARADDNITCLWCAAGDGAPF